MIPAIAATAAAAAVSPSTTGLIASVASAVFTAAINVSSLPPTNSSGPIAAATMPIDRIMFFAPEFISESACANCCSFSTTGVTSGTS